MTHIVLKVAVCHHFASGGTLEHNVLLMGKRLTDKNGYLEGKAVDPILLTKQVTHRFAATCHLANDSVNEGSPLVSISTHMIAF